MPYKYQYLIVFWAETDLSVSTSCCSKEQFLISNNLPVSSSPCHLPATPNIPFKNWGGRGRAVSFLRGLGSPTPCPTIWESILAPELTLLILILVSPALLLYVTNTSSGPQWEGLGRPTSWFSSPELYRGVASSANFSFLNSIKLLFKISKDV